MWAVAIVLAFLGAVILVIGSWTRYVANPTVVSLEKNYRDWDTVFPAFTLCYLDKVNSSRGKEQIKKLWGDVDESRKKYYLNFISHVANASLANLHEFQQYDGDSTLDTVDLEDLALNIQLDFYGDIMFGEDSSRVKIRRTVTELGHCFTWGSRIAQHFSDITKRTDQLSSKEVLAMPCRYVNLPCVVSVSELLSEVEFYVHPPDEMPMYGRDKSQIERKGEDREVFVVQRQMVASPELRRLYPVQRECLFQDETLNSHPPIYTYNICKMECRKKMSLQFCNCIPFFYRTLGGKPICNTTGMACLARFQDNITYDVFRNRVSCPCYQQCESMDITVDKETTEEIESLYEELEEKIQFHIKIEEYTKTRYRRDIIFSYEDLVVSFGGTVSLFLRCSILSGVELVYFFTIRLICRLWMKRQATNNTRSQQLRIMPMK